MHRLRNIDIKYIKGIGPKRAELLTRELGIHTAYDLLHHFPTHYIDRSRYYTVRELVSNTPQYVLLRGRFVTFNVLGEGVKMRLVGLFSDGTATMEVVWFKGIKHMRQSLTTNKGYILFGKPGEYMGQTQMSHPEIYMPDSVEATEGMRGVYPLTERLRQRGIGNRQIAMWVRTVLDSYSHFKDPLPAQLVAENHLCDIDKAIRIIHNPTTQEALAEARLRLKFEEVLYLQVDMLRRARKRKSAQ
ncbi:MAG: ATP-dependent DNA helicase RecG, partial [Muribaculaceae bacterium]